MKFTENLEATFAESHKLETEIKSTLAELKL